MPRLGWWLVPVAAGCGVPNVVFLVGDAEVPAEAGNVEETPASAADAPLGDGTGLPDAADATTLADASSNGPDAPEEGDAAPRYCTQTPPNPPDGGTCCAAGVICTGTGCNAARACIDCVNQCHTGTCCVKGNQVGCFGC